MYSTQTSREIKVEIDFYTALAYRIVSFHHWRFNFVLVCSFTKSCLIRCNLHFLYAVYQKCATSSQFFLSQSPSSQSSYLPQSTFPITPILCFGSVFVSLNPILTPILSSLIASRTCFASAFVFLPFPILTPNALPTNPVLIHGFGSVVTPTSTYPFSHHRFFPPRLSLPQSCSQISLPSSTIKWNCIQLHVNCFISEIHCKRTCQDKSKTSAWKRC